MTDDTLLDGKAKRQVTVDDGPIRHANLVSRSALSRAEDARQTAILSQQRLNEIEQRLTEQTVVMDQWRRQVDSTLDSVSDFQSSIQNEVGAIAKAQAVIVSRLSAVQDKQDIIGQQLRVVSESTIRIDSAIVSERRRIEAIVQQGLEESRNHSVDNAIRLGLTGSIALLLIGGAIFGQWVFDRLMGLF